MSRFTVTPWRTTADLHAVRQQLYQLDDDGQNRRRHAVDRVLAWKLRGGNLPHAVESTALLVDAVLHQAADVSGHSVRAVYTAAFTRFVTGFCDIVRARERMLEPSSMLQIARQIGMPPEFVALRHEATHEELPGLKRLVAATEHALAWLWQVYWSKLDETTSDAQEYDRDEFKQRASQRLREVRRRRLEMLKRSAQQKKGVSGPGEDLGRDCIDLCMISAETEHSYNPRKVDDLIETLLAESLLMPSKRELGAAMDGAFLIWDEVFTSISLHFSTFWLQLIDGLLANLDVVSQQSFNPIDSAHGEGLVMWLLHLLGVMDERSSSQSLSKIVRWCCTHPSHWAYQLGVGCLGNADESFVEHWSALLEASKLQVDDADAVAVDDGVVQGRSAPKLSMTGWRRATLDVQKPIGVV